MFFMILSAQLLVTNYGALFNGTPRTQRITKQPFPCNKEHQFSLGERKPTANSGFHFFPNHMKNTIKINFISPSQKMSF